MFTTVYLYRHNMRNWIEFIPRDIENKYRNFLILSLTKCKRGVPFDVQGRRSSNALLLCPALSGCKVSTPFDLLAVREIGVRWKTDGICLNFVFLRSSRLYCRPFSVLYYSFDSSVNKPVSSINLRPKCSKLKFVIFKSKLP